MRHGNNYILFYFKFKVYTQYMNFKSISQKVETLYSEMSKESLEYSSNNSISCPSKCDHCCKNSNVSATPLEMLPLALELIKNNNLDLNFDKSTCIFNQSGCSVYSKRPTVCRLFGWSKVSSKEGQRLSMCPKVLSNSVVDPNAPDIELWARKIKEVHPEWGSEIIPINQALKIMIEKILLYESFR